MGSIRQLSGETPSKHADIEISKAVKRLVDQHGGDADIVAAKRADAFFRDGKTAEGSRWLEVFRRLAVQRRS